MSWPTTVSRAAEEHGVPAERCWRAKCAFRLRGRWATPRLPRIPASNPLTASDLYHREELARLAAEHENLEVIASALSVEDADDVLATPIDTLAIKHANKLASTPARIYLCGAPELVNGLRRRLFIAGIPLRSILADAFLPAAPAKPAT